MIEFLFRQFWASKRVQMVPYRFLGSGKVVYFKRGGSMIGLRNFIIFMSPFDFRKAYQEVGSIRLLLKNVK